MWERSELKQKGKNVLNTTYWNSVLVCFVLGALGGASGGAGGRAGGSSSDKADVNSFLEGMSDRQLISLGLAILAVALGATVLSMVINIFVIQPVQVGAMRYFMESRVQKSSVGCLGFAFKQSYINIVIAMFLRGLFISLWSLLLVIPGIIKAYEYRMIPYIMAENPEISYKDAFRLSREMMNGEKMNTFILDLSFFPWALLGIITCGVGFIFYVAPYMQHTYAELYAVLREKILASGVSSTYELKGFSNDTTIIG